MEARTVLGGGGSARARIALAVRRWCVRATTALLAASLAAMAGCAGEAAEGRSWVRDVRFHGNKHYKGGDLLDRVSLSETSWIPLSPKHYLDPLTLDIDRRRIQAFYQAHGYFNARVTSINVEPSGDGAVSVDITVDEGDPTKIREVHIEGLDKLSEEVRRDVQKKLPLVAGQVYEEDRYLAQKQLIEGRLREHGYAFVKVEGEALVDRDQRTAIINFHVTTGVVTRYGRILVVGTPLKSEVARRSALTTGNRYDPRDIDLTRGRLNRTGLFSSVAVRMIEPAPGQPVDVADVEIRVTPGKRNELRVGIGALFEADRQTINLPTVYRRYGFLGGLRQLEVRAAPGWMAVPHLWDPQRQGPALVADVTFRQPDLWTRNLTLRVNVGYDLGVYYAFNYQGPRGLVGLDYLMLRDRLAFDLSYNAQFLTFWDLAAPNVFNDPTLARQFLGYTNPYRLTYLLGSAVLDFRDNPLDVRRGFYLAFTAEYSAGVLGSGFNYVKLTPDGRVYLPLGPRIVLSEHIVYGKLYTPGTNASPITRRYYGGGTNSHRGFAYARLSPYVPAENGVLVPVGGDQMFMSQTDLRFDLFKLKGNYLGLAVFFDAGDVPPNQFNLAFGNLNLATGGGLLYHTPIGVIRVDIGVRLNRLAVFEPDGRPNPDPGKRIAYHIMIGEPF